MALDSKLNRQALMAVFPDLRGDGNFHIMSKPTPVYNCIAWAMGYTDRWVDHFVLPGHWWPDGVERSGTTKSLVNAFIAEGFDVANDDMPEDGYEKVVLYKKHDSDEWAHASRILSADMEHSKFGQGWDAWHSHDVLLNTGSGYKDQSYGVAYAYMKRKNKIVTHPSDGVISVNTDMLAKIRAMLGK